MANTMKFLAVRICCRFSAIYRAETAVIVEAEFDAMLVIQEAGDLCASLPWRGPKKTRFLTPTMADHAETSSVRIGFR